MNQGHFGQRQGSCPNCGGPIEFKLGSSSAIVCPWCRHSVVRTDRDLQSIGKVADLVPTAAFMSVGDAGTIEGEGFVVGGRHQLDHGSGPWDEFYVEFSDGRWGWVAKAQGRFYVTYPHTPTGALPTWDQMTPGTSGHLEGTDWSVAERGQSALVSAEGELPFPAKPGDKGRYVDLEGPGGAYATIDYGDGTGQPDMFIGRQVEPTAVVLTNQGVGPRPEQNVDLSGLKCPNCGGPMPIHTPESTERVSCQYCHTLCDFSQGNAQILEKIKQPQIEPLIPLGSTGTIRDEEVICIGFMQRYTVADGELYNWREYLFHAPGGYRWLMEDGGHFTWLKPISRADINVSGMSAKYGDDSYRLFSTARGIVEFVIGEFYWKVKVGDEADLADYISPPKLISEERTPTESTWSSGEYVPGKELWEGLSLPGKPPRTEGVGVVQPNPHKLGFASGAMLLMMVTLCALGSVFDMGSGQSLLTVDVPMPPTSAAPYGTAASFTPTFAVGPRSPLAIHIDTSSDNQWIAISGALVHQQTGDVTDFFVDAGYYHGYSYGENWTEGSRKGTVNLSALPAGTYFIRLDPQWTAYPQPGANRNFGTPTARLTVRSGKRGASCMCCSMIVLFLPWLWVFFRRSGFESRRNLNSSF